MINDCLNKIYDQKYGKSQLSIYDTFQKKKKKERCHIFLLYNNAELCKKLPRYPLFLND